MRVVWESFQHRIGQRRYRLVLPSALSAHTPGLVLMLHGCGQGGEECASSTGMDAAAGAQGYAVLYPEQSTRANTLGCWNWYEPRDQQRESGEAALLAALTLDVLARYGLDAQRVYVAGFSAGGAMALLLVATWPELFASVGVHSGLPRAGAGDLFSAMRLMQQGPSPGLVQPPVPNLRPAIVFQGDVDRQVNPLNALWVVAQALGFDHPEELATHPDWGRRIKQGQVPGGLHFTRTRYFESGGEGLEAELWRVHGGGHGWSGGLSGASHTEPGGPDASREMLRFFAAHPLNTRD